MIAGGSLHNLLRAVLGWFVTALILLLVSADVLSGNSLGEQILAYLSSLISFAAAFAAGISAAKRSSSSSFAVGLRLSLALVVLLLTAGFLIAGKGLSPSGILSAVSFTFAGCLTGSVLFGGRRGEKNRGGSDRGVRMKSLHKTR